MTDVFAHNWLKRSKKNPVINSLIHNTEQMIRYKTRLYERDAAGGFRESGPRQEVDHIEPHTKYTEMVNQKTFAEDNRAGRIKWGDVEMFTRPKADSYWEYRSPGSLYQLKNQNPLYNPLFDHLFKKHR